MFFFFCFMFQPLILIKASRPFRKGKFFFFFPLLLDKGVFSCFMLHPLLIRARCSFGGELSFCLVIKGKKEKKRKEKMMLFLSSASTLCIIKASRLFGGDLFFIYSSFKMVSLFVVFWSTLIFCGECPSI
jgi:hypothetical protein